MNKHLYYFAWFCIFLGWSIILGFTGYLSIAAGVLLIGALMWELLPRRLNSAVVYAVTCLWCWAPLANLHAVPLHVFLGGGTPAGTSLDVNHAVFNGSQYLRVSSATPSGLADGYSGTISFWVKFNGADLTSQFIFSLGIGATQTLFVARSSTLNRIVVTGYDTFANEDMNFRSTNGVTAASGWTHIMMCWTIGADTSLRKIYINGVSETLVVTTWDLGPLNYADTGATRVTVGGNSADVPLGQLNGAIAELWFDDVYNNVIGDYYSGGKAVALGSDGSTPTGSQPIFYYSGAGTGASWTTNSGTGGALTINSGSLTTDADPPEYP